MNGMVLWFLDRKSFLRESGEMLIQRGRQIHLSDRAQ